MDQIKLKTKSVPILIESAEEAGKTKMLSRIDRRDGGGEAHSRLLLRDSGGPPACSKTPIMRVSHRSSGSNRNVRQLSRLHHQARFLKRVPKRSSNHGRRGRRRAGASKTH